MRKVTVSFWISFVIIIVVSNLTFILLSFLSDFSWIWGTVIFIFILLFFTQIIFSTNKAVLTEKAKKRLMILFTSLLCTSIIIYILLSVFVNGDAIIFLFASLIILYIEFKLYSSKYILLESSKK